MVTIEKLRGHKIERLNGKFVYSDTKEPTKKGYFKRPCGNCGKDRTKEGHDGCLGTLPGVMNACCGHGEIDECYIQFLDGSAIYGKEAKIVQDILKDSKSLRP